MLPGHAISSQIWDEKYRYKHPDGTPIDQTQETTQRRIARALAQAEAPDKRPHWEEQFFTALQDWAFLPAGRIIAGAGTGERNVTLFNCFVMGTIHDSMDGIFSALREAALTMQQGGGIGYDFSTIRPRGAPVVGVAADASGPLSFMDVWDAMCRTLLAAGARRGAMMATMRCDHPDIFDFVSAKQDLVRNPRRLSMFNLSVLCTSRFMAAVERDAPWDLVFAGKCYRTVHARELWQHIMRSTYASADPGVIFIDRINDENNLGYCEEISATNPCGEQPLPPYGACLLGSINLPAMLEPGTQTIDTGKLLRTVRLAIRMMDNTIDVSKFALEAQAKEAKAKRRIGLGITGLGSLLSVRRIGYGSVESQSLLRALMEHIRNTAYETSAELAQEKGSFPLFDAERYCATPFIQALPTRLRELIHDHGIRNSHLLSIAPTGTISLLAGNVSSGIEPIFAERYTRKILQQDGTHRTVEVKDYAVALHEDHNGPEPLITSIADLTWQDHLVMQSIAQRYVDSAISKTVNLPESISFEEFQEVYLAAYNMGCKGCTTYRPNEITGSVLEASPKSEATREVDAKALLAAWPTKVTLVGIPAPALAPRPPVLSGSTYKLRWGDTAIYLTINSSDEAPFEIFLQSKDISHQAWTQALTRMISAVYRRGGNVAFVAQELQEIYDPKGGNWIDGKYVVSLPALIGQTIAQHYAAQAPAPTSPASLSQCPKCHQHTLTHQSGCETCLSCHYSRC